MTHITLPRATVEQALEALETAEDHLAKPYSTDAGSAITALRAALAQQAEPDNETRAEFAEQQVVQLAEERDHYRNLWQKAQQAEPVTIERLRDALAASRIIPPAFASLQDFEAAKAVLHDNPRATLAQQAEPVEPRRWEGDHNVESPFNACMHKSYCITLKQALAQQAEPVAEARYDGTLRWLEPHGVGLHRIQGPLYTAPPQRKPLTDEEIDAVWDQWFGAYGLRGPGGPYTRRGFARAVERAHGITDPQVADRLARHGIPMPEAPTCPDCHGVGYDASGQLCACQQNPSF